MIPVRAENFTRIAFPMVTKHKLLQHDGVSCTSDSGVRGANLHTVKNPHITFDSPKTLLSQAPEGDWFQDPSGYQNPRMLTSPIYIGLLGKSRRICALKNIEKNAMTFPTTQ